MSDNGGVDGMGRFLSAAMNPPADAGPPYTHRVSFVAPIPATIRLDTAGLLSKWGFGDGDCLDDLLWDMVDDGTLTLDERRAGSGIDFEHGVLVRVVREFVLPAIEQTVEVYEIGTIHNPIRASSVNGREVDDRGDNPFTITPEWVEVASSEVARIAREVAAVVNMSTPVPPA